MHQILRTSLTMCALVVGIAAAATAQTVPTETAPSAPHGGHGMAHQDASPATAAYAEVMAQMHSDMAMDSTGDADVDFVRGMIPHHQGAIDMARVVLKYGQDPQIRDLAQQVIDGQEAEVSFMRDWLTRHGHAVPPTSP